MKQYYRYQICKCTILFMSFFFVGFMRFCDLVINKIFMNMVFVFFTTRPIYSSKQNIVIFNKTFID